MTLSAHNVDAAVWCSYKYLNSGPGCMGGLYINQKHLGLAPGLQGWHGNKRSTQFLMREEFEAEEDARKYQISNFDPMQAARIRSSLELFKKAGGIEKVRERNNQMCVYFIKEIENLPNLRILTPR